MKFSAVRTKIVSIILIGALFVPNPALGITVPATRQTLAPPLAIQPPCKIVNGIRIVYEIKANEPHEQRRDAFMFAVDKDRIYRILSKMSFIKTTSMANRYEEVMFNSFDAVIDKMEEYDFKGFNGKIIADLYVDGGDIVLSVTDNGKTVDLIYDGTPIGRFRKADRQIGGVGQSNRLAIEFAEQLGGTVKWYPLKDGTRTELRVPRGNLPGEIKINENDRIVIEDEEEFEFWDRETVRSVRAGETLGKSFRNRWAFVDMGFLMGQALKLQISKHTLLPLIKEHLEYRDGTAEILLEGYDIDGIEEVRKDDEIIAFSLPVTRNGKPAYKLVYSLTKDKGADTAIPLSDGTNIYVKVEVAPPYEKEGSILAPSILNVPDDQRTSKAAEAIEIGREEGIRVIAHFDVIESNDGKGTAIVQPGAKDTMDELKSEKVKEIIEKSDGKAVVDVHLMVMEPTEEFIQGYIKNGAGIITLHWEGFKDKGLLLERLRFIRKHGVKAGLAMNPDVDIEDAGEFISEHGQEIDMVLQMSVYPGLGGQKFMKEVLGNIVRIRKECGYTGLIEIDGGVNKDTIKDAKRAGANVFVAGSAFFRKEDMSREGMRKSCRTLKASLMEVADEASRPGSISGLPVTWTGGLKKDELRIACVQLGKGDFDKNTERIKRIVEDLSRLGPNAPDMAVFPELIDEEECWKAESQERVRILQKVSNDTKISICCSMEHKEKINGRRNITTDIIRPEGTETSRRFRKLNFGRENRIFSVQGRKIALLMCVESIAALKNTADARKVTENIEQADLILVPSTTSTRVGEKWPEILKRRFKKPVIFLNMADGKKAGRSKYITQDDNVFVLNRHEAMLMADVREGPKLEPEAEEKRIRDILYRLWSGRESEIRQAREELAGLLNELPEYDEEEIIYAGSRTPLRAREIAQAAFYILAAEAATEMGGYYNLLVDDRFENAVVEHIISILTREDAVDCLAELDGRKLADFWQDGDLDRRPLWGKYPLLTRRHVRYWTAIRNHEKVNPDLKKKKALYLASLGGVSEGLLAAGCRHLVMMDKKNFYDPARSVRLSEKNRMIYREMKRGIKKGTESPRTAVHDAAYQYLGGHLLPFVLDEMEAMEARDILIRKKRLDEGKRSYYEVSFKWAQWGMEYEDYVVSFIDNYAIRPQGIRESLKAALMDTLLKEVDVLMLKAGLALSDESQPGDEDGIYTSEDAAAALGPYINLLGEDGVFVADVSESRRSGILSCNERLSHIPSGGEITAIETSSGGIWFGYNPVTLFTLSREEPVAPPDTISGLPVTWTEGLEKEGLRVACVQLEKSDYEQNTERIKAIVEDLSKLGPDAPDLVIFPELLDKECLTEAEELKRMEILQEAADKTEIAIGCCIEHNIMTDRGYLVDCHIIYPGQENDNIRYQKFSFGEEDRLFTLKDHKIALLICVETVSVLKDTVAARKVSEEIENADLLLVPSATRLKSAKTWTQILQERYKKPVMLLNRADGDKAGNSSYRPYKNKVFSLGSEEEILIADVPEGLETGPDIGEKQARNILYRLWSEEKEGVEAAKVELSELLQDRFRTPVDDGIYVGNRTPLKAREIAEAVFYILGEEAAERSGDIDLLVDDRFKSAVIEHIIFILSQEDAVDHMAKLNGLELANFWNDGDLDNRPLHGEDPLLDERHVRYWSAIRNHEKVNPDLKKDKAVYLAPMAGVSEGLLAAGGKHLVMIDETNFYNPEGKALFTEEERKGYREVKRMIQPGDLPRSRVHDGNVYYGEEEQLLPLVLDELDGLEARDVVVSKRHSDEEDRDYYEIRFKWAQWGMEYEDYLVSFIDNFTILPESEDASPRLPFQDTLLKDVDILMLKAGLALSSEEYFEGTEGIDNPQDAARALTPYIRLLDGNGVFIGDVTEKIKKEILLRNKGLSYVQGGDEIRKIESEEDGGIWFGYNPVKLFLLSGERGIYPNSIEGIPVLWAGGLEKHGLRIASVQLEDDEFDKNTERIKNIVESLSKLGPDAPDLAIFPEVLDKACCSEEKAEVRIKMLQEVTDKTNIAIGLCIEYESPDPEESYITYNIIQPGHAGRHIVFRKAYYSRENRIFSIKDRKMELLICVETQAVLRNVVDMIAVSKEIRGSDMIIVPAATSPEEVKKWGEELRGFFGKPVIYLNWSHGGKGGNTSYYSKEKKIGAVEDVEAILIVDAFREEEPGGPMEVQHILNKLWSGSAADNQKARAEISKILQDRPEVDEKDAIFVGGITPARAGEIAEAAYGILGPKVAQITGNPALIDDDNFRNAIMEHIMFMLSMEDAIDRLAQLNARELADFWDDGALDTRPLQGDDPLLTEKHVRYWTAIRNHEKVNPELKREKALYLAPLAGVSEGLLAAGTRHLVMIDKKKFYDPESEILLSEEFRKNYRIDKRWFDAGHSRSFVSESAYAHGKGHLLPLVLDELDAMEARDIVVSKRHSVEESRDYYEIRFKWAQWGMKYEECVIEFLDNITISPQDSDIPGKVPFQETLLKGIDILILKAGLGLSSEGFFRKEDGVCNAQDAANALIPYISLLGKEGVFIADMNDKIKAEVLTYNKELCHIPSGKKIEDIESADGIYFGYNPVKLLSFFTGKKYPPSGLSAGTEQVWSTIFSDTLKLIQAKREEQPIILALGTSWIKGYEKGRYLQYDALNPLISSMREFCRGKGITFIDSDDSGLLAAINAERDKEGKKEAKVIVLAGKDTVTSDEFGPLRSSGNIFMAGVDNEKLTIDSYMRLMEMMTLTLQLAFGRDIDLDNPDILIKKDDRFPNVYIFIPNAEPMDYEILKEIYRVQIFA